ncbi:flocculation protein FLO11-like isoform X2 [Mastacembelus armatus]|uniref:Flocculation protein FLO11-like n=1 Tax=Mastacembelus armatus TaxID=205130 RepID=A0A3Q3KUY6_9TELE|nr:flocculation protein FLO11-like isoform X2 [Mastacembelus armatus]
MALSQIQCLDENHVNPRTHESKPDFFYSEEQRLALEALLRDGREAFIKYLEAQGLRGFLSDPEVETLAGKVVTYDPDSELFLGNAEDDEPPLSLHYWPDLSDISVPQLDLGWPDSDAYRGVTRATVYTQPPLDGQAHIKEIVRKMIVQAQKVIAVAMDVFTDVDIFRDLLDAGFKRKVSVYILLERTTIPHFLSMCQRANMHAGHLKHLRVRCTEGSEFYSRSCTKVRGRMGHRFMFVDGDKAVSGSYSFTWMSSRLDRNLITMVTGQAVDAFDRMFRVLYETSSSVDLRKIATEPEPEPEPLPQTSVVVPPSAEVVRKLYNPKYALVAAGNPSTNPTPSADHNNHKETPNPKNSKNPEVTETKKRKQRKASKEALQEAPPLHPGLTDLEKASLISYLPTWPEPDPPSDVIGYINIRDASKRTQVHLQRSEMFETSQAIRFSSPISVPKETLPEVAKPRLLTAKHEEMKKPQPAQDLTKAGADQPAQVSAEAGCENSKEEAHQQKSSASGQTSEPVTGVIEAVGTDNTLHSNTPNNQDAGHNTTPHLSAHTSSNNKTSTPNNQGPAHTVPTNRATPESHTKKEAKTSLNTHCTAADKTHIVESNSTPTDSNSSTEQHTQDKTGLPLAQTVHTQPQNSSEMTPNIQTPTVHSHISISSTSAMQSQSDSFSSVSENDHDPPITSVTTSPCAPLSSIDSSFSSLPPLTHPPLPSSTTSSSLSSTPPIPKPRTVHLVIKDNGTSNGQNLQEISVNKMESPTKMKPEVVHSEPDLTNVVECAPGKQPGDVSELQSNSESKVEAQKDADDTRNPTDALQPKQSVTSQHTKGEELHDNRADTELVVEPKPQAQSDVLTADAPKTDSVDISAITLNDFDPRSQTSIDCKIPSDRSPAQTDTKAPEINGYEFTHVSNGKSENLTESTACRANPQRVSNCENNPLSTGALEAVNLPQTPASATINSHISKDNADDSVTSAENTDREPNTAKHNTHINVTSQESQQTPKPKGSSQTPERPLHLNVSDTHMPDLCSQTPKQQLHPATALICATTADVCSPSTPSDGYVSPREDSIVSTTSEEFYECSDSPSVDAVFDRVGYHVNFTNTNTLNATTITSTPHMNNISCSETLGTAESTGSISSTETQSVCGHPRVSSSSLLEKKIGGKEETANVEENGREDDAKERKLSVAETRTEQDSKGTERKGSEEAKRTIDHLKEGSIEMVENDKKMKPKAPGRKRSLKKSAAETMVDGNSTNQGSNPKRLSTGGSKPERFSPERERPGKEKVVDKVELRASIMDRRERPQTAIELEGQKLLHTPSKLLQGLQQQVSASPSRAPRPPRPLSATQSSWAHPLGSSHIIRAESKVIHGSFQVLDNTSSVRRPLSRPSPPLAVGAIGSAAGQKQAEVSRTQQSLLSRQPPALQARVGQSQKQHHYPKPSASFLHTHANIQSQLHPHYQNQAVSVLEAHRQEDRRSPFTITFSRLYNLKGLKDKMNRFPAQGRRVATSSSMEGHKSTS